MATVGEAYVKIIPDASGFSSKLKAEVDGALDSIDKSVQDTTEQIGDEFDKAAKESGKAMSSVADQIKEVGKTVAAAFVTREIANFAKDSIRAASDLNESINAVQVTFGDASRGILDFGKNAAQAVGLSTKDFNSFAVQFAGFTKQIAGANGDVVKVTTELTTRIADFASVMNLDIPQAAQVFQSSLAGETESIRRFGIDLSAAAVETYALANGLISSSSQMTAAIQVQARYGLLMQETAKVAGDFSNTSDSLANRQRILAAEFENIRARIGEGLLPVMEGLAGVVGVVMDGFAKLPAGVQQVSSTILISTGITAGLSRALQGLGVSAGLAKGAMGLLNVVLIAFTLNAQRNASEAARAARAMDDLARSTNSQAEAALANVVATRAFTGASMKAADILADVAKASVGTAQRLVDLGVAQKVLGISTEEAQKAIEDEVGALQQQNTDLQRGAAMAGTAAGAQSELASATGQANSELERQALALQALYEAALSQFESQIAYEQAQRASNTAVMEYNTLVQQLETGTYRGADAFGELATSSEEVATTIIDQAKRAVELAESTAAASGAALSAEESNRIFREEIGKLAETLAPGSPARARLDAFIAQLDNIKPVYRTTIITTFKNEGTQAGPLAPIGKLAEGTIATSPRIALIAEAGAEAVIPLTRPARALELMRESGLDQLVMSRAMANGRGGATVNIENAVFQNATDANLVAQKVNAAELARSFAS